MKFWTSSRCINCAVLREFSTPIPDFLAGTEVCLWCGGSMRPFRGYDVALLPTSEEHVARREAETKVE